MIACSCWCVNSCVEEPSGARQTPRVCFLRELVVLGMVVGEEDLPEVMWMDVAGLTLAQLRRRGEPVGSPLPMDQVVKISVKF